MCAYPRRPATATATPTSTTCAPSWTSPAGAGAHRIVVVTDGVFSMDGSYAPLPGICDLAEEFQAMVMVDDSHAVGFVGPSGRGHAGAVRGGRARRHLVSGTLGKALGGASGGYIAGPQEVVDLLRQRSRPYLFSNAVAPSVVAGSMEALRIASTSAEGRDRLVHNAARFRAEMTAAGFDLLPGTHPIVPVMFPGDDGARRATRIADRDAGRRRVRDRLLLPRGTDGSGADPCPALGGAHRRRHRPLRRRLRGRRGEHRLTAATPRWARPHPA
ncbi:MAG: aminotransferase class I/II-fold pyridoxal phosphate-dependent enzyme [Ilumatobacteraceae bacterium]